MIVQGLPWQCRQAVGGEAAAPVLTKETHEFYISSKLCEDANLIRHLAVSVARGVVRMGPVRPGVEACAEL
jgi:hypothetical protein